jgi:hypothetical protein
MTPDLWLAFIGLVAAVLLTGYALFWAITSYGLGRDRRPEEVRALLRVVRAARWPHVVVPWRFRLPFPVLGWAFLVVLALVLLVNGATGYAWFWLLAVTVCHAMLTIRPGPALAYGHLLFVLMLMATIAVGYGW